MAKVIIDFNSIEVIYEGYLKKSPPLKVKSFFSLITKLKCAGRSNFSWRWRKRYFVLYKMSNKSSQINLVYFNSKPTSETKSLGRINLDKMESLTTNVDRVSYRPNVFSIQTYDEKENNRIYYLKAPSFEIMNNWVDNIVQSLKLNSINPRIQNATSSQSPTLDGVRGWSHIPFNHVSSPLTPSGKRTHKMSENSGLPLFNMGIQSQENNTSYYNLDGNLSPSRSEELEDPICTEEDVYKIPNDSINQHAYINLEDENPTHFSAKSNRVLSNYQNFQDIGKDGRRTHYFFGNQDYKFPVSDYSSFENKHNSGRPSIESKENSKIEDPIDDPDDFNFPLPTRIRNSSSTSSSNSSSDSSSNSLSDKEFTNVGEPTRLKFPFSNNPPELPKRIPRCSNSNSFASEAILPAKTPRVPLKPDFENDKKTVLNYVEGGLLLLDTAPTSDNGANSSFVPFFSSSISSHEPNLIDFDNENSHFVVDSCRDSSSAAILNSAQSYTLTAAAAVAAKEPLIEYREISNERTEALMMLNMRIQKNE